MFASEVTTRASTDAVIRCSRTARCRCSSAALGACDMNGCEPLLERRDHRARQRFRQFRDGALQLGIVGGEEKSRLIVRQRLRQVAATMMDVAKGAKRSEILRGAAQYVLELLLRFVQPAKVQQRATERHPGGEIAGMSGKTVVANLDGVFVPAEPPALFGELRKSNRRRILFDPASKLVQSDGIRHAAALRGRG